MNQQLPLDLPPLNGLGRADFIVTNANRLAVAALDGWLEWPLGKMVLAGPAGSGKTHLARIWADETGARTIAAAKLAEADLPTLAAGGMVVVEDGEALAAAQTGDRAGETALFHLHNLLLPEGRLLVTAGSPPRDWGLVLPDLISRLQAAALTRLEALDDALLQGVLSKLFADRQLTPPVQLIPYLLLRMPRSIGAARALVAELDNRALAEQRPIGLKLAAEVLEDSPAE